MPTNCAAFAHLQSVKSRAAEILQLLSYHQASCKEKAIMRLAICLLTISTFMLPSAVFAADPAKDPVEGLKCFIMPKKDVKGKKIIDWKGGKLYLCCSSCVRRMERTPEKYSAKANHQLVQTGQFANSACPMSGDAVSKDSPSLKIEGAMVMFSSQQHLDAVKKMEAEKQIEAVFNDKAFKKGQFKLVKKS